MNDGPVIRVRDVMRTDLAQTDGMATVQEVLGIMRARNISSVVVQRRDADDEYGLVHITDLAREIVRTDRVPARTHVYEIMVKPAPAVDAEMNVKYAARMLHRLGLTHAIVLDGRELVGVVTLRELVLRYIEERGDA